MLAATSSIQTKIAKYTDLFRILDSPNPSSQLKCTVVEEVVANSSVRTASALKSEACSSTKDFQHKWKNQEIEATVRENITEFVICIRLALYCDYS